MIFNLIRGIFPFAFKKEILHYTSLTQIESRLKYRWAINAPLRKLISLQSHYLKISKIVDLDKKFIYIGLHMQPEKTSQPLGMYFDHQFLAIKVLADSLPKGWKLYVKEHPNQFNAGKISNNNYRDRYFYDAIMELSNVELVSLEQDSQELIDHSQIVATLTGTMGWEALQKGIPVLAFGNSFYSACRAVRRPTDVPSCIEAINFLSSLSSEDIERELYAYLKYYSDEKYIIRASNSEARFAYSDTPRQEQIDLIANTIMHHMSKVSVQ